MPEKPLTIATYAAGASLAAITLVYVFAPTFFIDGDSANGSTSTRKRGVVGLSNPANDCFINSVLQALAGLGDLRLYLIREIHRRKLDGPDVYTQLVEDPARKGMPAWKIQGLQTGLVTQGLKEILDALNERPIYKKTISAARFVQVLETAFKQRISRQQQDAQEFLQVVAERLCDEYHAGHRARNHAMEREKDQISIHLSGGPEAPQTLDKLSLGNVDTLKLTPPISESDSASPNQNGKSVASVNGRDGKLEGDYGYKNEDGFPFEGVSESQIECETCGFKPKPTKSTFCSLTLSVPQVSSTSLSSCFDQMFKTEYIDGYKCDKCRLQSVVDRFEQEIAVSTSEKFKERTQQAIERMQVAIKTNPEEDIKGVELPDSKFAPQRRIAKHVQITTFPKIVAIHLSRSIFDATRSTMKNSAKVSFPEVLPLGGLKNRKIYRLSSVVCHKGSHHSGHYETFRRQTVSPPFATPNPFQPAGVYSKPPTPQSSQISTPQVEAVQKLEEASVDSSTLSSTPELLSPSSAGSSSPSLPYTNGRALGESLRKGRSGSVTTSNSSSTSTDATPKGPSPTSAPRDTETGSLRTIARSARSTLSKVPSISKSQVTTTAAHSPTPQVGNSIAPDARASASDGPQSRKKRQRSHRWWRISDEKIKEAKTSDVLSMQKEVYLLFYELERDD